VAWGIRTAPWITTRRSGETEKETKGLPPQDENDRLDVLLPERLGFFFESNVKIDFFEKTRINSSKQRRSRLSRTCQNVAISAEKTPRTLICRKSQRRAFLRWGRFSRPKHIRNQWTFIYHWNQQNILRKISVKNCEFLLPVGIPEPEVV